MAVDERATVAALDAARAVFKGRINRPGRADHTAGDSVLAVFETATGAVVAALEIQEELAASDADVPEERQDAISHRPALGRRLRKGRWDGLRRRGQHCGPPSDPGQPRWNYDFRCCRGAVRGKVAAAFQDQGEQTVKNIAHPVRAFALRADGAIPKTRTSQLPLTADPIDLSLPDKPSIAVLPFTNMSGVVEQDYFCDGITEDIITEMSRFDSLFVIARNSTFSYKGKSPDVRQVGRELGVR